MTDTNRDEKNMGVILVRNRVSERWTRVDTLSNQWLVWNKLDTAGFGKRSLDKRRMGTNLIVGRWMIYSCRKMLISNGELG